MMTYQLVTTCSIYALAHYFFRVLTPKLNSSALSAIISRLVHKLASNRRHDVSYWML